jgi:uncharacterized protein
MDTRHELIFKKQEDLLPRNKALNKANLLRRRLTTAFNCYKTMPKTRSKRLRKKLHLDEFEELGFSISFALPQNLDNETLDIFLGRFITDVIEHNDLSFGGGIGPTSEGFVTLDKRGNATEEHRVLVRKWLASHPFVSHIQIGELVDAWG